MKDTSLKSECGFRLAMPGQLETHMILDQSRIQRETDLGIWPNRVLTDYLMDYIAMDPDRPALISHRADSGQITTVSYGEINERAERVGGNLMSLGIKPGDVVSFQLPNWWEFVAIHLACLKIGAISNPVMPIFRARELEYMIGFAESRVFIVPQTFQNFDYEGLGEQLLERIPSLQHLIVVGGKGKNAFETLLLKEPEKRPSKQSPHSPNDVVELLYTSGTTGKPKGVMHTSNTLLSSATQVTQRLALGANDIGFMPAPFAHQIGFCFGMMTPIKLGIPLVIMDVWNPAIAVDLIEKYRVTYTCASTPFLVDLSEVPEVEKRDLSCFRMFMTAGAPILEPMVNKVLKKIPVNLVPGWGMTEVIQVTATEPFTSLAGPLNDGAALPGNEVRVVDNNGKVLPAGKTGFLQCRGSTLFVGYCKKPDLYSVDSEGWFDTGDLAWMDENGNIRIAGRDKDIIIRGGENIPVLEVESLISELPQVHDVAMVGMPDERLGERGCVFVTLLPDTELSFAELVGYLKSKELAKQYFPERLEIVKDMPRTPSGKIQKFVLRERAAKLVERETSYTKKPNLILPDDQ